MKTVQELVIGSAVFLLIDRAARLVSHRMSADRTTVIHIELVILALTVLIAWKVF
jgi:hypothetical protein